jgi:hypothetical protein
MAKLHINIGDTANDRTGDPLRTAFEKVNSNFDELYARTGDDIQIPALAGNNGKVLTISAGALSWATAYNDRLVSGQLSVIFDGDGHLVFPAGSEHYDLGAGDSILSHVVEVNSNTWAFGSDGQLTLPGTGTISNPSSASSTGTIYTFLNDGIETSGILEGTTVYLENNANSQAIQSGWIITFADSTQKTVLVSDTGMPPHAGQRMLTFSGAITKVGEDIWPLTVQSADYGTGTVSNLEISPDGTSTWIFNADGTLEVPGGNSTTSGAIQQRNIRTVTQGYTTVEAGSTGIIYSASAWQTGFKLTIMVESRLDNNTDDIDHTQVCEVLIAANYNSNADPVMTVYGITYTSPSPLATFEVQRSGDMSSGTIEVVATNVQAQYNLSVNVHAVQFSSVYD